jgi:hypothetical protein
MRRITVAWMASLALIGAGTVLASPALGAQSPVLTDCFANGRLTQQYSIGQLRTALSTIPVSATEYSICYDVIQRQLFAQIHPGKGNGSGSGSGGSFLPTPVIIVLVLLLLGAVTFGAIAIRSRAKGGGDSPGGPGHGPPDEPA